MGVGAFRDCLRQTFGAFAAEAAKGWGCRRPPSSFEPAARPLPPGGDSRPPGGALAPTSHHSSICAPPLPLQNGGAQVPKGMVILDEIKPGYEEILTRCAPRSAGSPAE